MRMPGPNADSGGDGPPAIRRERPVPGPLSFLRLSAGCGLVAGLLEVGTTVLYKNTYDINRLYWTSRQFVWLVPLTDLAIFLVLGLPMAWLWWRGGRRGRWLASRLLAALTLLPPIWAASTRIAGPAGVLLALGIAARLVPTIERHPAGFRRMARIGFPAAVLLMAILAASPWASDRIKEWRQSSRPLPISGEPNVLLLVLDTVAADHLGLYGYDRPTCPTLDELAARGIRFDRAQATAPWTLASHASMFTGRWPHEPLRRLGHAARRRPDDPRRLPGRPRLCHRWIRRQLLLLRV